MPRSPDNTRLKALRRKLAECGLVDRRRLQAALNALGRRRSVSPDGLARLEREFQRSIHACQLRGASIPQQIDYPPGLPISATAAETVALLRRHPVLVVSGDTGSGKTTQLPKICLQAGYGRRGLIGHTQPRRLAAMSVAARIAGELGTTVGQGVGYQIRFDQQLGPACCVKLMTDGILLAEIQQDRRLERYEAIIVDEAHERSLNVDFLLGFLKRLLRERRDLKLIITSATIDVEKFSRHFDGAPVVAVSGRSYPVETRYAPLPEAASGNDDRQIQAIVEALQELAREDGERPGDVLVFLATERDIRRTALALRRQRLPETEILPLYARLPHSEQGRIFQAHKGRRVVLATNVAETSITVPGIRYVIDTGYARISRYSLQSKVQRLPIEAISQASANQRKGRCGRLEQGVCIRLYAEHDFAARPLHTDPEIKRTNLAAVILRMSLLGLGRVEAFPFLEPPPGKAINEGYKLLSQLDALDGAGQLTGNGRDMALLPVDPRYARMLISATAEGCLREMLIIVSALSIQDPRELAVETRRSAMQRQARFNHPDSDFLSLVNLWEDYERRRRELSQKQLRKHCKTHFLSFNRMQEWREVHRQLLFACRQRGFRVNREAGSYRAIHQSIISASLNLIGRREEAGVWRSSRNRNFSLLPPSVLASGTARWIVVAELMETSRTFATVAALIKPQWVEQAALHLVRREHFEPHWDVERQQVMAWERTRLYGLVIIERAPLVYARIDPAAARTLFIDEGLVAGALHTEARCYQRNQAWLKTLASQERKLRRPDSMVSERAVFRFYDSRIPPHVNSTRQFESWLRQGGAQAERLLTMSEDAFADLGAGPEQLSGYPDQASIAHNQLQVEYRFHPGDPRDGATIDLPVAILPQLRQADLDWAVPGIVRERCIVLLKRLPRALRRQLVPISDFVDRAITRMERGNAELLDALIAAVRTEKGLELSREDFRAVSLPPHLQVKIRVVDPDGAELALGDRAETLQAQLGCAEAAGTSTAGATGQELTRDGIRDWTFGELPRQLECGEGLVLIRYPALVDRNDSVAIELFADPLEAARRHETGLVRLFMLRSPQQKKGLEKQLAHFMHEHALLLPGDLLDDMLFAVWRAAFATGHAPPRDRSTFEQALRVGREKLFALAGELEQLLGECLRRRQGIVRRLRTLADRNLDWLTADVEGQLQELMCPGFLRTTDLHWLRQFPRYLEAIEVRLARAPHVGPRDQARTSELRRYRLRLDADCRQCAWAHRQELRWMLEEYRVALFAQSLGTSMKVSARRLDRRFEEMARHKDP